MEPDYLSVLYQWLLLFALFGIILFPAFRLKRIAKVHGKRGWIFFIVGLIIGILVITINSLVVFFVKQKLIAYRDYFWIPYMTVGYTLAYVLTVIVARGMKHPQEANTEEVLDFDLMDKHEEK